MFRRADKIRPGSFAALDAKALQLIGKDVAKEEKSLPYAALFQGERKADLFVTYCTNAVATAKAVPGLTWIRLPPRINVGAVYGAGMSAAADAEAAAFVQFLDSTDGRRIFEHYGFE